jgi:glutathione S-transferase
MPPTKPLTLHQQQTSGNSYKIRLTASLLGIKFARLIEYNALAGDTRTADFRTHINANSKVPVLQVGEEKFLPESNAASYYLAHDSHLIPTEPFEHAQMLQWMFFEQYSHEPYIAVLRVWMKYIGEDNLSDLQKAQLPGIREKGQAALQLMDDHLAERDWFVGGKVSVADVALYAYTHMCEDGGFRWEEFPNVKRWCARIEDLEGYVGVAAQAECS